MKLRNVLFSTLIASSLFVGGCASTGLKDDVQRLQGRVDALNSRVEQLKSQLDAAEDDTLTMCFAAFEMSTGGSIVYIGDGYWMDMTGNINQLENGEEMCAEALDLYRKELESPRRRGVLDRHVKGQPPVTQ